MAEPRSPGREFGVETIHLDLPPLAGSLGQRLRDAGVPVTPERSADFARALTLVRPNSRRRLYWTARSVFVSDRSHAEAFDAVFRSVFGGSAEPERAEPDELETVAAPPDDRPQADDLSSRAASAMGTARRGRSRRLAGPATEPSEGTETGVPLAMASDEEVLAARGSTRSSRRSSRSSTG